jgi:hypothetical protein
MKKFKEGRDVLRVQGYDGNWNYDSYMHGMYNGMELMLSLIEGREPEFKEAPLQYKCIKKEIFNEQKIKSKDI